MVFATSAPLIFKGFMPAASTIRAPRRRRKWLVAPVCLAWTLAHAQSPLPLAGRLADIRELNRYNPERALPILQRLEPEARASSLQDKAEFLVRLCEAYHGVGQLDLADAACEEVVADGHAAKDDATLAKGLLYKSYVVFSKGATAESHRLVWESEKIASRTSDRELQVRAMISSGLAFVEEGNYLRALERLQAGASLARQGGEPVEIIIALNQLARLYGTLHEYDKGFATLAEANAAAVQMHSPNRISTLKETEYALAIDSGQTRRAREAMLAALAAARQIGAKDRIARALGNLADCYLKLHEYDKAIDYANQAYEAARALRNEWIMAVSRFNIGQALIAKGRLTEGKRYVEEALVKLEKADVKPTLQAALAEYGVALEAAGDPVGAVKAYHRERALSNLLFEQRRQKATLELQAKYEADKNQQQIELLRRENKIKSAELDNRRLQQRVWWLLAVVFALASIIVGTLYRKVRNANAQLEEKNLELKQQSVRDSLTGLYNRRHFQDYMRGYKHVEKRGAGMSGEEVVGALFLLDVDHFKNINDSYGHAAGDCVLKAIAVSLREVLRGTDMIVRWGGEEFIAFLPAIPKSGLDEVARRLLTGISSLVIEHQGKQLLVNVSIGFAPYPLAPAGQALSWERAVNLVDMALYLAKAHGRNRAYGVCGFARCGEISIEEVEQDLEHAWREGFVDLSIVLGGNWPELRAAG
jgi:diguanylate cyclase (GGDEF)-like protein